MPFARTHCSQIKTTNQSLEECLIECQSLLLHMLRAAPLPRAYANSVKLSIIIIIERTKLSIPPLPTTSYTTKTSKQKKTNEEKQAKKKELDLTMLQGGALEARIENCFMPVCFTMYCSISTAYFDHEIHSYYLVL